MAWLDLEEGILELFTDRRAASPEGLSPLGLRTDSELSRRLRDRVARQTPEAREGHRVYCNEWRHRTGRRKPGGRKLPAPKTPEELAVARELRRAKERARYHAGKLAGPRIDPSPPRTLSWSKKTYTRRNSIGGAK